MRTGAFLFSLLLLFAAASCGPIDHGNNGSTPNNPPTLSALPNFTVQVGQSIQPLDLSQYVQDENPSSLTYAISSQSDSSVVNCSMNDTKLESSAAAKVGTNTVAIKVTDDHQQSATGAITITVTAPPIAYRVYGLNTSLYIEGQDPNTGVTIGDDQIRDRLSIIAPYTTWIRTYGSTHGLEDIPRIARELGLKVAAGAWLSKDDNANAAEIANLIANIQDGYVDIAVVGSEVLLRGDFAEDKLLNYIARVRSAAPQNVLVTTADTYGILLAHPNVVAACDVIFAHYYPWWEGQDFSKAVALLNTEDALLRAQYPDKEVIVAESGWPSGGDTKGSAVPSPQNAAFYFLDFVSWARANTRKYFYFEAFDEAWKAAYEGPQGAFWGVWDQDGDMKVGMSDVFDGKTVSDNWTCGVMPGGSGTPSIQLTSTPPIGSYNQLHGQVWHVTPSDYYVAVYIHVLGGWWTKPTWASPRTLVNCDGTWVCSIVTGGVDEQADQIAAYLLPMSYDPPSLGGQESLPPELDVNAVAKVIVTRTAP